MSMFYSQLSDEQEQLLEGYGLIDGDTIGAIDFQLNPQQLNAIQRDDNTATQNAMPQNTIPLDTLEPYSRDKISPTPLSVRGDTMDYLDSNQANQMGMKSDTIDYTTKMSLDSQDNQFRSQVEDEKKALAEDKSKTYQAEIDGTDLNTGKKADDFRNALRLQAMVDSPAYDVDTKKYALSKLRNRFGMSFDRVEPKKDDYGKLVGAKAIPKGVIDQGLDMLFTAQARDFTEDEGYLSSGFDKTMGVMGAPARTIGAIDNEGSIADERTMYETDEVEAIRDRQAVTIPTLERSIGTLLNKEKSAKTEADRRKLKDARVSLQGILEEQRSPSGMEMVAELGSASIDPMILFDLGLVVGAGKKIYEVAKGGKALNQAKGLLGKLRPTEGADIVTDGLDEVVDVGESFVTPTPEATTQQTPEPRVMNWDQNQPSVVRRDEVIPEDLGADPYPTYQTEKTTTDLLKKSTASNVGYFNKHLEDPNLVKEKVAKILDKKISKVTPEDIIQHGKLQLDDRVMTGEELLYYIEEFNNPVPVINQSNIPSKEVSDGIEYTAKGFKKPKDLGTRSLESIDKKVVAGEIPRPFTPAEVHAKNNPDKDFLTSVNRFGKEEPTVYKHGSDQVVDRFDENMAGVTTNNNTQGVLYNTTDTQTAQDYGRFAYAKANDFYNDKVTEEFLDGLKYGDPDLMKKYDQGVGDYFEVELSDVTDEMRLEFFNNPDAPKEIQAIQKFFEIPDMEHGKHFKNMPEWAQEIVDSHVETNPSYINAPRDKRGYTNYFGETINGDNRPLFEETIYENKNGYPKSEGNYDFDQYDDNMDDYGEWNQSDINDNADEILEVAYKDNDISIDEVTEEMIDNLEDYPEVTAEWKRIADELGIKVADDGDVIAGQNLADGVKYSYESKRFDYLDEYAKANHPDLDQSNLDIEGATNEVLNRYGFEKNYPDKKEILEVDRVTDPISGGYDSEGNVIDLALTWDDKNRTPVKNARFQDQTGVPISSMGKLNSKGTNPRGAVKKSNPTTPRGKSVADIETKPVTRLATHPPKNQTKYARTDDDLIGHDKNVNVDEVTETYGANKEIKKSYDKYMAMASARHGIPKVDINAYARTDPERSRLIADEYQKMKHQPNNPVVKEAYKKMADEVMDQYQVLVDDGWTFSMYPRDADGNLTFPYGNPRDAIKDMRENKHLYVFPTSEGFGTVEYDEFGKAIEGFKGNPLEKMSGIKFADGQEAFINDIFRAVHDVFGHGMDEVGFRARGEEHTWRSHARMFSPEGARAVATETRGQNSWLNFNPISGKRNQNAQVEDTKFADQKTGLMPKWVSEEGLYDESVTPKLMPLLDKKGRKRPNVQDGVSKKTSGDRPKSVGDIGSKGSYPSTNVNPTPNSRPESTFEMDDSGAGDVIDVDIPKNELQPIGRSIASLGQKLSVKDRTSAKTFGNFLQGLGIGISELENAGFRGLSDAIRKGGYEAFVDLPEKQKDALKNLIHNKAGTQKIINELGAREGQIPKEFADEILEGFVTPRSGTTPQAKSKQKKMWRGTKARRLEEEALGDLQSKVASENVNTWINDFLAPKGLDGKRLKIPEEQKEAYRMLAQKELTEVISKDALRKILIHAQKGSMSYPEVLDTIRALDEGIDFTGNPDAIRKALNLRRGLNEMIIEATENKINLGDLDGFFGEGVDTATEYKKLRKALANASQLNSDFRAYAKLKGKSRGLSDFEIDQMADKVANAFGKILSKRGQAGSKLENNTGFKLLKSIDNKQGTDFSNKVKVIWELYTNPQIEVTKVKGQNALTGFRLPPRAQEDVWSQAEYFGRGSISDNVTRGYKKLKSALLDWSQPRSDLGATNQNKMIVDLVADLSNKVPTTFILNLLQDKGIPARQIVQIMRPLQADKSDKSRPRNAKDVATKDDREVSFNKSLSEIGKK